MPPRGRTARRPRLRAAAAWTAALAAAAAAAAVPSASRLRRHGRRSAAAAASPGQPAHCSAALREAGRAAPSPPPPPPPQQQQQQQQHHHQHQHQLPPQPRRPPLPASLSTQWGRRRSSRGPPPPSPRLSRCAPRKSPSRFAPPPCRRSAPRAFAAGCAPQPAASPTVASPAAPPRPPSTGPAPPSLRRGLAPPRRATPPRRPPPRPSAPPPRPRGCGVEILPPRAAAAAHSGSAWGGCRPARRPRVLTMSAWYTGLRRRAAPPASAAPCSDNARECLGAPRRQPSLRPPASPQGTAPPWPPPRSNRPANPVCLPRSLPAPYCPLRGSRIEIVFSDSTTCRAARRALAHALGQRWLPAAERTEQPKPPFRRASSEHRQSTEHGAYPPTRARASSIHMHMHMHMCMHMHMHMMHMHLACTAGARRRGI